MLSIAIMSGTGLGAYYSGFARADYYLKGGEPPGLWFGEGAIQLGLQGVVEEKVLREMLLGFSPDGGAKLVQNAGRKDRQSGWDLTFSAPKSVSVLWAITLDPIRRTIETAHQNAVRQVLGKLEQESAFSRRGKGGANHEKSALAVAVFGHGTSRNLDPQLHSHALVLNVAVRRDGTVGTLLSKPLYERKMEAGRLYRDFLGVELQRELGLAVRKTSYGFELAGIPDALTKSFSSRRAEIVADLAERGLKGAKAAKISALNTRSAKGLASRSELFKEWRDSALQLGFGQREIAALFPNQLRDAPKSESQPVRIRLELNPGTIVAKPVVQEGTRVPASQLGVGGRAIAAGSPVYHGDAHKPKSQSDQSRPEPSSGAKVSIAAAHPPARVIVADKRKLTPPASPPRLSYSERQDLWREELQTRAKQSPQYGRVLFRIPLNRLEVRLVRQLLFPRAPSWSPFRGLALPRIIVRAENRPFWSAQTRPARVVPPVLWQKQIGPLVVQARRRSLFPNAPRWSPLFGQTVPELSLKATSRAGIKELAQLRQKIQRVKPPEPPPPPMQRHDLNR